MGDGGGVEMRCFSAKAQERLNDKDQAVLIICHSCTAVTKALDLFPSSATPSTISSNPIINCSWDDVISTLGQKNVAMAQKRGRVEGEQRNAPEWLNGEIR